jgi:nucleoside-diphosphate-sugar epimerase
VETLTGGTVALDRGEPEPGDVYETGASIERARKLLGWQPRCPLEQGLAAQVEWQRGLRG